MCHAGSFSRSAVNHESGAKTGLAGIVTGIIMGCALLFLTQLFEYIPQVCFHYHTFLFSVGIVTCRQCLTACSAMSFPITDSFEQNSLLIKLSVDYYRIHGPLKYYIKHEMVPSLPFFFFFSFLFLSTLSSNFKECYFLEC